MNPNASEESAANRRKMTCLVVDDDLIFGELVALAAKSENVLVATSIQEAIAIIDRQPPDYVLLDLTLRDSKPQQTMDLIRELKTRSRGATIIVVTNDSAEETRLKALQRGADLFLVKSGSLEWFQDIVSKMRKLRGGPC